MYLFWAELFRIIWNTSITLFPLWDFMGALNLLLQVWAIHYPSLNSINQLTLAHAYEWLLKVTLKWCKKDIGHIFQHKYQLKINIFKLFSKARFTEEGIFSTLRLFASENFINKKVGIQKN